MKRIGTKVIESDANFTYVIGPEVIYLEFNNVITEEEFNDLIPQANLFPFFMLFHKCALQL